ncbi:hypothetical protein [Pararhizobium sp. IMCC21322]|uniref:hypothetical protein n=1 Tax=Pararhizobium sp. IMCC21322 TaxID=3067903 RepID=UPI0027427538|nr:hypothetical protein [Pararhizobium sp. IMCC21322]
MHAFLPAIRLFLRVWIAVALVYFCGLAGWHFLTQEQKAKATIDASIERVLLGLQAGAAVQDFLDAEQISALGKQFIVHDIILGGKVLSPTGDVLTSFGRQPFLTWQDVQLNGEKYRYYSDDKTLDVSFEQIETGFTYQLILRIPGPGHALSKQDETIALSSHLVRDANVAASAATAVALLFLVLIVGPHRHLQQAAIKAASASKNVAAARLKWRRGDSIGVTARAIDALIVRLHYLRESELAPLRHAFHKSGFPILKFNANGRLSEANEAAAHFFERENSAQLKDFDFLFTTIAENTQGTPLALSQASEDGSYQGQILVQTDKGNSKICFADITAMSSTEARKNAAIQVVLADATTFFTRLVTKEQQADALEGANREVKRHSLQLQRQLEALASMSKPFADKSKDGGDKSVFISMERLINEWYQENEDMGDRPDDFDDKALEAVSGNAEIVRIVVRQAYNALFSKCGEISPRIEISSRLVSGRMAEFSIEQIPQPGAPRMQQQDEIMDWTYNFKAFQKALGEAGGKLVSFDPNALEGKIVMQLPAFRAAGFGGASSTSDGPSMRKAG